MFFDAKAGGLMERIMRIATNPATSCWISSLGSGTTAQAVLNLNKEDGGNRRFILVSSTEATADAARQEPLPRCLRRAGAAGDRRLHQQEGAVVAGLGGGFAYLRCRRIPAATVFRGIQHAQVWTALQLIHDVALTPYQAAVADADRARQTRGLVIYLPKLTDAVLDALQTAIHGRASGGVFVATGLAGPAADRSAPGLRADSGVPGQSLRRAFSAATGGRP
jgi:adenine-specific DNA-methyltransferase